MKKRILCLLLAAILLMSLLSPAVSAQDSAPNYFYVENTTAEAGTVSWKKQGSYTAPSLEYSTDGTTWNPVTFGTVIGIAANGKVYFRGENPTGLAKDVRNYIYLFCNRSHKVGGDLTTLLNKTGNVLTLSNGHEFSGLFAADSSLADAGSLLLPATTLAEDCYNSMFGGCSSLTAAPALPAMTLADSCYSHMFEGCNSLKTAPALPATTLADSCYYYMFSGCSSLTEAPALPATMLAEACYTRMFWNCNSLTAAPALPATTLADSCYSHMFEGCNSLKTAPTLPATTLTEQCYSYLFAGCSSLTAAPMLPATTLAADCYSSMFYGCSSLTAAPELPATTLTDYCYFNMFNGCAKISSVSVGFTTFDTANATTDWLKGVAENGTLYVLPADFDGYTPGTSTVPEGWTVTQTAYRILVESTEHGTVTAEASAGVGTTVEIKVTPDEGWLLRAGELKAIYYDGTAKELTLTPGEDGVYTFTMPAADVTVTAEFAKASVQIGGKLYAALAEALDEAESGDTVTLLQDAEINVLLLFGGVTLDLNGRTLTAAKGAIGIRTAEIIDSNKTSKGLLKVEADELLLVGANGGYVPLYDAQAGGYRFFKAAVLSNRSGSKTLFTVRLDDGFTSTGYDLLKSGTSGAKLAVDVTWKQDEDMDGSQRFTYSASLVGKVADDPSHQAFSFVIGGLTPEMGTVTVTPCIVGADLIRVGGSTYNYTAEE